MASSSSSSCSSSFSSCSSSSCCSSSSSSYSSSTVSEARTRFTMTLEDKYTRYGLEDYTAHLYEYPVTINNDYTVTGTRATDSDGDYITGTDVGDGVYDFEDVAYGEYAVVVYRAGIIPQVVTGWHHFVVLPRLEGDEIACAETHPQTIKDKLNEIIQYILDNDSGWTGTPPTLIT